MRKRAMNMNAWIRKYQPIEINGSIGISQFVEIRDRDPRNVWSVVESDTGKQCYIVPGFHIVNMIGYIETRKPWTDADDTNGLSVLWD